MRKFFLGGALLIGVSAADGYETYCDDKYSFKVSYPSSELLNNMGDIAFRLVSERKPGIVLREAQGESYIQVHETYSGDRDLFPDKRYEYWENCSLDDLLEEEKENVLRTTNIIYAHEDGNIAEYKNKAINISFTKAISIKNELGEDKCLFLIIDYPDTKPYRDMAEKVAGSFEPLDPKNDCRVE